MERKVSHLDVMNWFRTHYEGTEYDMRLGVLAGPWQSPVRAERGVGADEVPGQFARATSIQRTTYTVVVQSHISHPVVWFAPDSPASSVFVPFFSSVLAHGAQFDVEAYGEGSRKSFSFFGSKLPPACWAFDFVANWMELSYQNMSETYVHPKVQKLQYEVADAVQAALNEVATVGDGALVAEMLGKTQTRIQRRVTEEWWELAS